MNRTTLRSLTTIGFVCIALVLMCAFFVDESYAALIKRGTTIKKEQTVKMSLKKGTCLITVKDKDSWVYSHIQQTGNNTFGTAVNGDMVLAQIGQEKSYTVPIKKTGTYYLYLHGVNAGATYKVQHFKSSGTLKNDTPRLCTSFADNKTVTYYKFTVPGTGQLRIKAVDASPRYRGYSKIRLKKDSVIISEEEHLIRGLGFSTTFGVTAGTYYIGVRSSSELFNLTATFTQIDPSASGNSKTKSVEISRKATINGVNVSRGNAVNWYKIILPSITSTSVQKRTISLKAQNNNTNLNGGIQFKVYYTKNKNGKHVNYISKYLLNNSSKKVTFSARKNKSRTIYIRVASIGGASGIYTISWK